MHEAANNAMPMVVRGDSKCQVTTPSLHYLEHVRHIQTVKVFVLEGRDEVSGQSISFSDDDDDTDHSVKYREITGT